MLKPTARSPAIEIKKKRNKKIVTIKIHPSVNGNNRITLGNDILIPIFTSLKTLGEAKKQETKV